MNNIIFWSITVAIAGFLFGFDTAVISGADQPIQQLWNTSPLFHGAFIMSSALWGTVIGSLAGSYPCDKFGRKWTLIVIGLLYFISALGSAVATDPYMFSFFRFIGGLGVGVSTIAVPAYIAEIAPTKHRGRLIALYQFQLVFGILIAFLSNYFISGVGEQDWRWMLGVEIIPAIVFLGLLKAIPESPRWLMVFKNDEDAARNVLHQLYPNRADVDATIASIKANAKHVSNHKLFSKEFILPMVLVFLLAFFNQASGINFIIYFSPRVFELAGLESSLALLSTAGIGLVNLFFTLVGLYLIDKVGRKKLMLLGSIGYIISLSVVAWAFMTNAGGLVVVFFVFAFIASHAIGQGAVIWVFIAEIFPNVVRTKGQALGCGTHWVMAAILTLVMPWCLTQFTPSQIFSFFAGMMILQLIYVIWLMPETKGLDLESVSSQ
ncbi:sugar porter family MFS transporter [Algibacillus agarilyticus]|uniref:sugar porter family MFS transporter n=1 Tax=Algibacillus agarilyticus TaxID=2234133 RepID=UPI000DCFD623|nr:sugar porter family MFS transporter [Algibacillus agarilyticus]